MKLAFFAIPVLHPATEAAALNAFLAQHRVVTIDRHLITEQGASVWAVCVSYLDGAGPLVTSTKGPPTKERIDYKEVLSPEEFSVYSRLREVRKAVGQEAGVPIYSVFTNEQLAAMVRGRMQTKADLQTIEGVGAGRVDKYGGAFSAVLREAWAPPAPMES